MKIDVLIPARKGSKRLKNKNIYKFKKKELFLWSVIAAKHSKYVRKICISSDDERIEKICKKKNINFIKRPKKFSNDRSNTKSVILHYLKSLNQIEKPDLIVLLQPTSPLREKKLIDNGIKKILSSKKATALIELCPIKLFYGSISNGNWESANREGLRKQDISPIYIPSGRLFIYKVKEHFFRKKKRIFSYITQDYQKNLNIDTSEDINRLHTLYKLNSKKYKFIEDYKL